MFITNKKTKRNSKKETLYSIVLDAIKGKKRKETISSQDTIPFKKMYPDGLCQINENTFNKTIRYADINYQLSHPEDKQKIFSDYSSWLNYFDHSVKIQLNCVNQILSSNDAFKVALQIEEQDDAFNDIRAEYRKMLHEQLEKGNNGLIREKDITFTIQSKDIVEAKNKLTRIETDIINNFKLMGVYSYSLSGAERLKVLHDIMNPVESNFNFSWDECKKNKLSPKDYIAPKYFDFRDPSMFSMGKKLAQSQHMIILAPELSDRILTDFLDMESEMVTTLHIQSIEQSKAIKTIKRKITDIDKMKIDEQMKANRAGYDMDVIPTDLATYSNESKKILNELQARNERWFMVTVLITNFGYKKSDLQNNAFQAQGIAQKYNCSLKVYTNEQEECFKSILPLGINNLYPKRGLTTSSTAVFIPFTTQELFQEGQSMYYGLNALSNNMIMVNRKNLKNPNGLILGVPGAGKSFSSKREMTNVFFTTKDDIYICDPQGEYRPLVETLDGQIIEISPTSKHHINPLDISQDYSDDDSPIALKVEFVLSMMELICGGKEGLSPTEISIIDKCLIKIYQPWIEKPIPDNIPILEDLYDALLQHRSKAAEELAASLEIYVHGSLKVFNNKTNVNIHNRIVCFDLLKLGKTLKKLGMLVIQDQVYNRVITNNQEGKSTWYYIDEFHMLLKETQTAKYSVEIWKMYRKLGGIPTGITQNVKDLLSSPEIEVIFDNTTFIYLLSQAPGDKEILADKLKISSQQLSYVTNSPPGEGLIIYDGIILPFRDQFPKDTMLYKVMTTNPEELAEYRQKVS